MLLIGNEFAAINFLLTLFGLRLGTNIFGSKSSTTGNRWFTIQNRIGLISSLIAHSMALICVTYICAMVPGRMVAKANLVLRVMSTTIFFFATLTKRESILRLTTDVISMMADKKSTIITRYVDRGLTLIFSIWAIAVNSFFVYGTTHGDMVIASVITGSDLSTMILSPALLVSLTFILFNIVVLLVYVLVTLYIFTQINLYMAMRRAECHVRRLAINSNRATIKEVRKLYVAINKLRVKLNDAIGLYPFLFIAHLFISLALQVTDFITNRDKYGNATLQLLMVIEDIAITAHIAIMIVFSCLSEAKFDELKRHAMRMTDPSPLPVQNDFPSVMSKLSLQIEMTAQPQAPTKALNMFNIDQAFVIKFMGALIPFIVMVITTFEQLDKDRARADGEAKALANKLSG